jgi:hypothetical protein
MKPNVMFIFYFRYENLATITYAHHVRGTECLRRVSTRNYQFSDLITTTELGKGENPELNIASLLERDVIPKHLTAYVHPVVSPKVKTTLSEVNSLLSSCVGILQGCNGENRPFSSLNGVALNRKESTNFTRSVTKVKS